MVALKLSHMEVFSIQRKLSTYSVNNQLLRNIEGFVIDKIPGLISVSPGSLEEYTTLSLSGPSGTEKFKPASKYKQQLFDNDIERITFEVNYYTASSPIERQAIVLIIRFSRSSDDTDLSISLKTQAAKEKALGFKESLLKQLGQNKNMNWIPYPNEVMPTLIFVGGFIALLFVLMLASPILKTIFLLFFAAAIYLVMHRFLKGYCSFDSNRQKRMDSMFKWTVNTITAFIIVSLLTPLRRQLWGF